MTPVEFQAAAARTKLRPQTIEMARLVLIDGLSYRVAAERFGLTRQRAEDAVRRVEREYRGIVGAPPNWAAVTVCVPWAVVAEIKAIEARERYQAGLTVDRPRGANHPKLS